MLAHVLGNWALPHERLGKHRRMSVLPTNIITLILKKSANCAIVILHKCEEAVKGQPAQMPENEDTYAS
jgi:hypothetical protein